MRTWPPTPGEGRGLSSRQTQDVVRDLGIGQPMSDGAKDQRLLFYFWASSSIFAVLEGALKEDRGYAEPWSAPDPLRHFIDAAVAMLEAPLTSAIEDVRRGSGVPKSGETGRRG